MSFQDLVTFGTYVNFSQEEWELAEPCSEESVQDGDAGQLQSLVSLGEVSL